jgi:hypothetical protein
VINLGRKVQPPQCYAEQELVMMRLRLQMLMPVSAKWSWKRRTSSGAAASGDRFRNAAKHLQLWMWLRFECATEFARIYVLDHPLPQRRNLFSDRDLLSEELQRAILAARRID